jgi:prophage antirepressor-like protein
MSQLKLFSEIFQGHTVRYEIIEEEMWVVARDLASILGKTTNAITKNLNDLDAIDKGVISIHTLRGQTNMVTVNENGIMDIILQTRSKSPQIREFKRWVRNIILQVIRNGHVDIRSKNTIKEDQKEQLKLLDNTVLFLKSINCLDDDSKLTLKSLAINNLTQNSITLNPENNTYGIQYRLTNKFNVSHKNIRKYSMIIGRLAVSSFRLMFKKDPPTRYQLVSGYGVHVYSYKLSDYNEWLDELISIFLSNQSN